MKSAQVKAAPADCPDCSALAATVQADNLAIVAAAATLSSAQTAYTMATTALQMAIASGDNAAIVAAAAAQDTAYTALQAAQTAYNDLVAQLDSDQEALSDCLKGHGPN